MVQRLELKPSMLKPFSILRLFCPESCVCVCVCVCVCTRTFSHSVESDSVTPWTVALQAPLSMRILQVGKNTGVGCHALFQTIFLT